MYKKLIALLLLCNLWYGYGHTETDNKDECASIIPIPDPNFEIALFNLGIDDMPSDGQVPMGAIMNVINLDVSNQFISDLSGIEHFAALQTLNVSGNNLTNLNLNGLSQLIHLYANDNMLNVLDLNNVQSLQYVQADNNNLFQVNIQSLSALVELSVNNNNLSMLEVFSNMNLETLRATNNMLMTLEVGTLTNLKNLDLNGNSLQSLSLEPLVNLENLVIANNQFSTINLGFNTALINFDVQDNQLTSIDLINNVALRIIRLNNNNLTSANLRNGNNTNISSVNLTGNSGLTCVFVDDTAYSISNWTDIDVQTLFTSTNYCRYTIIPDINFEAALGALTYDDIAGDGRVPTALIENVTALNLSSTGTTNLMGIEDFTALENFQLNDETIPTVNLSSNTQLKTVEFNNSTINNFLVDNNPLLEVIEFDSSDEQSVITNLNLSNSPLLRELDANSIGLVNLTLPDNIQNLEKVFLEGNNFESLDLSGATSLTRILLGDNTQLNYLNLQNGNNTNVTLINLLNTPNLTCVLVDDATYSTTNWTVVDNQISFSGTYCRYTAIQDANFELRLGTLGYDDIAADGQVPTSLIENVQSLTIANLTITDLTGIEDFTALQSLEADFNNLTTIDLSNNLNLTYLDLNRNDITSLDLTANTLLENVRVRENELTELDMRNGNNTNITFLDARNNPNLSCIFVDDAAYSTSNWTQIDAHTQFSATGYCRYTSIPDSNFEAALNTLGYDDISGDQQVPTALIEVVTSLDVNSKSISNMTGIQDFIALTELEAANNPFSTINVSTLTDLEILNLDSCPITSLDVSSNLQLKNLDVEDGGNLNSLNLTTNTLLEVLDANSAGLTSITFGNLTSLKNLYLSNNLLQSLDLSALAALEQVFLRSNSLSYLNIKNGNNTAILSGNFNTTRNPGLFCILVDDIAYSTTNWTAIELDTSFSDTYCRYTAIPDSNFEAALDALGHDNISGDGQVPTALIEDELTLDLRNASIADLTGIEDFTALRSLRLTNNSLTSIDLSQNLDLDFLWCNQNSLTSLDLSNNTGIRFIAASENAITSFDATGLSELTDLSIWSNQLSSINLTGAIALRELNLFGNSLTELDVSENASLKEIGIRNNSISSLDLTSNPALISVDVRENGMTYLNVKNGFNTNITNFRANSNSNLNCILVDDAVYSTTNWTNIDGQTSFSDTYCRYTAIPDINFEATLEALGYDDIPGDGQVPTVLIEVVDVLQLDETGISDLTGIEAFTVLENFTLSKETITTVNLSANTLLKTAEFNEVEINNLVFDNNPLLEVIEFDNFGAEEQSSISSLDLTNSPLLIKLDINDVGITDLTLPELPNLTTLFLSGNNFTSLDASSFVSLRFISLRNNNSLSFLNLKNGNNANIFSANLQNIPNLSCILVDDAVYSTTNWTNIDPTTSFSDTFCRYTQIPDADFEAQLTLRGYDDIPNDGQVPTLLIESITTLVLNNDNISDVTGIEDFTSLKILSLKENDFTTIDLSQNTLLESINFEESAVESINISNNPLLRSIDCNQSDLLSIDISNVPLLEYLNLSGTEVETLDTNNTPLLTGLNVSNTLISILDVSNNSLLTSVRINGTDIVSLDLSHCSGLIAFNAFDATSLTFLNMQNGNNANIIDFNTNNCDLLSCVLVDDAAYSTANWTRIEAVTSFSDTYCRYTAIPDSVFEADLGALAMDDIPNDGQVPTALIENVTSLDIGGAGIADITGIEAFVNLEDLNVESNSFTNIDVSNLTKLKELRLTNCPITSLDVSTNVLLKNLFLENAVNLGVLDLSANTELINLDATNCGITAITFTTHDNLLSIIVPQNELTNLDLSAFGALAGIEVNDNNLSLLNVKNGNNGNLEIIDFTNNPNLACILVDDAANANANWANFKDATATYNDITCTNDFSLAIKVYLQGAALNPNIGEQNLMRDDLRVAGYLPTTSQYVDGITCEATVFDVTGDDAIVDWIWVELRDATNNTTVSYSRSALLQRDGDVVDIDGISALDFATLEDTYYVAVNHRSHLGIMTANAMTFTIGATRSIYFKNSNGSLLFGSNAQTDFGMPIEIYGMWCGNANGDTVIQYSGTSPDTPNILSTVLNDVGNFLNFPTYSATGYTINDANMDGIIQYSGTNPDTPFILQNVLAHPGNFLNFSTYQIIEQLPENLIQQ